MNIVKLQAENIKRIVAVEIEPDGALVQITGRNGAGKSSVLDAIWWALAGERSVQSVPIRKGQDTARIALDLGEVVVTRHFTRRTVAKGEAGQVTTRITVENAEGARFPSPQTMLDALLGSLSFDPLAFARASDREQVEQLAGLCGVDMAAVERAHKGDYERRRDCNRDAKQKRAAECQIIVPVGTPYDEISVGALVKKIRDAEAGNRERESERRNRERDEATVRSLRADAENAERQALIDAERARRESDDLHRRATAVLRAADDAAQAVRESVEKYLIEADQLVQKYTALPPVEPDIDTAPIQDQIARAERVNRDVSAAETKRALMVSVAEHEQQAKALTASMDARRQKVADAIAAADVGIDGLSIEDGRVTLDGLPIDQASDAGRLRLSCAIAMRGDAKLRVLRVRDGSLLDADSLALLQKMAEAADYQVWIEMVDVTGKLGIVIEDGKVKV